MRDLDLFGKVAPEQATPFRPHPSIELSSSFIKTHVGHGFSREDAYKYGSTRQAYLPSPNQGSIKHEPDAVPQFVSNLQTMVPKEVCPTTRSELQLHSPLDALKASRVSIVPFSAISSFGPEHHLPPLLAVTTGTHSKLEVPIYTSPAGRISSNDKHNVSEKHRRDVMGAVVQAIDIIGKDLSPGIGSLVRSSCNTCIGAPSQYEDLCISLTQPENITAAAIGSSSKKTKNYILVETLMWKFSVVLHHFPHKIGWQLDGIRALVEQMAREKEIGLSNDFAKSNKWNEDVRALRLKKILRAMVLDCARHGFEICACGKHHSEAWDMNSSGAIPTPPSSSSRTSPIIGQKRSREASDEDDRNMRRRDDMFFTRLWR